ncbi:hypothetical protein ASZ90_015609 [hydrocarbon metagenome]|uniref:Uncharacterized protein n=1 Tax=hydrocarbon metagenome TaxID=938273 RepID=A0A0W8F1J0_9ZZZZ
MVIFPIVVSSLTRFPAGCGDPSAMLSGFDPGKNKTDECATVTTDPWHGPAYQEPREAGSKQ